MESVGCAHCGSLRPHHGRGLCSVCYQKKEVRQKYPTTLEYREPTDDELEAMIAKQRENLPPWWNEPDPEED